VSSLDEMEASDFREAPSNSISQRFLISGASGFIGKSLIQFLNAAGHSVSILSRDQSEERSISDVNDAVQHIPWDPYQKDIDYQKLEGFDHVIHLAGENIAKRWTKNVKKKIVDSRVIPTTFLCEQLLKVNRKPKTFISASGIGFYGYDAWDLCDETAPQGAGFLAEVVRQWEAASAIPLQGSGIRVCHARFGAVMSSEGGALKKLLLPFQLGVGGPIGDGSRFMSAIAKDDLLRGLLHVAASATLQGPINFCFPKTETNKTFSRTLAKVLHRPCFFSIPPIALKLLFGEMASETILASQNTLPRKLLESGFEFRYPDFESCLKHIRYRTRSKYSAH